MASYPSVLSDSVCTNSKGPGSVFLSAAAALRARSGLEMALTMFSFSVMIAPFLLFFSLKTRKVATSFIEIATLRRI